MTAPRLRPLSTRRCASAIRSKGKRVHAAGAELPRPKAPNEVPIAPTISPADYPHFSAVLENVMAKVGSAGLEQSYDAAFEFGLERILDAVAGLQSSPVHTAAV